MLKIHKKAKAEEDLIDIWTYSFGQWGMAQADQYIDRLDNLIKTIAANPGIGTNCDSVRKGYRQFHVGKHYIFYRYTTDTVFIIRVLGNAMDYQSILQDEELEV